MKRLFLLSLFVASQTLAGNYLTQEMEALRGDLSSEDPSRRELTLRLADMYFDLSIKDDPENKDLKVDREKSLAYYQEALKGEDGFKPLEGETRLKVVFQCARLQDKLGNKAKAETLFKELYSHSEVPRNLKLEATLYLGELYEDRAKLIDASKFYKESLSLCSSIDSCNFAHYRLGWTYFKDTKLDAAIAEINLSLWDAKGHLRDQVVNDLISFMSQRQTDGKKELREMEVIIAKSKNQALMSQMAETFYLAGNRVAGGYILGHINKKTPSFYNEIRLLEESYGFRNWDNVEQYLNLLGRRSKADLPSVPEERSEVLKIHRRLIVQLDAEVDTNSARVEVLKRAIDLYLSFYPSDEMKIKMQEGWLKVESDNDVKIKRLGLWINENVKSGASQKDINNLRRTRLSLAQKQSNSDVVIAEANALTLTADSIQDVREYRYVAAYELNKTNKTAEAEVLFKKLIDESLEKNLPDQWMVLSQNLLLDNYNSRKDFSAISSSVALWTSHESMINRKDLADEFKQMKAVANQASFQAAVAKGDSQESLDHFFDNCLQNVLVPQSCSNAKILSVKLKDQTKLVTLLEMSKEEPALINEYELMGRFSDAARLREKTLKSNSPVTDYLKISLLYELDLKFDERNRLLSKMVASLKGQSKIDPKFEKLIYVTLVEAGMIDSKLLSLSWSLPYKMKIAQSIESVHSDNNTKKMILAQKTYQGAVWSKIVLDEVQNMDTNVRRVSFYSGNSKAQFKKKSNLLSRMESVANSYLQGADSETRVYLLSMMAKSNYDFAQEIINTPIPVDLDADSIEQVKASLNVMASAFVKSSEDYGKLMSDELAAIEDKTVSEKVAANISTANAKYASFISINEETVPRTASFDYSVRSTDIAKLKIEPNSIGALTSLENFYTNNKSERIASYFKERIQLLKN
jgi:hypothetical protein